MSVGWCVFPFRLALLIIAIYVIITTIQVTTTTLTLAHDTLAALAVTDDLLLAIILSAKLGQDKERYLNNV